MAWPLRRPLTSNYKGFPVFRKRHSDVFFVSFVGPPEGNALEQFERAKRYLARMENIYSGIFSVSVHNTEAYDDDVISFFIHCYHVRDWVIHLNKIGVTARQVDSYIDSHQALRICADLANGSKHCKLTRSLRSGHQPHIAGKARHTTTWLTDNSGGEVMKCKYTVLSSALSVDALELARECIQIWELYMLELQAAYSAGESR